MTARTAARAAAPHLDGHLASGPADVVFTGGSVLTMDAARRSAESVAVRDGRVVAVGPGADVRPLIGPRTRVVRLHRRTLLPGFGDSHVHPSSSGLELLRCPLHDLPRTAEAYLAAIRAHASAHPADPWVVGAGWYMEAFQGGTPSRADLDRAVPDRPAFFVNRDVHGAWVNGRALEAAGITGATPDPPDGRIERDAAGEPQGTLHEGAMRLVERLVPPPSAEELVRGLELAQAYLHRFGITGWQDAWVTPVELDAYVTLAERGLLTGRAIACHWWERDQGREQVESILERRRRGTVGRLAANTVKIMLDGVAENHTAAMLEPYLDGHGGSTGNRGLGFIDPEALKGHVATLDAEGFQVHFHALGDRAVRGALDAVEAAHAANGPSDRRHHLAHLQVVDPADVPRFRALGAVATIQPFWACNDGQMVTLTRPFLPPARYVHQYPFRSLRRAGATLAGGSDWSVSTPDVLAQAEVAVSRVSPADRTAEPFLPEEALDPIDILAAFTVGSAYVDHREATTGSIEAGKLADLVVLDRDILAPDAGPLGDARVLLTMVEGEPVHEDPALETAP